MRAALALAALAVALAGCERQPAAPPAEAAADTLRLPTDLAERIGRAGAQGRALDRADGYALAEVASTAAGRVLVQWIDLRRVTVESVLGSVVEGGAESSPYHPTAPSPAVELLDPAEVVRQAEASGALAVLNGAFFETPGQPSSQLAFPLAIGGAVVTGGSSPYGPGQPGADARRWGAPLRALGLGDSLAHVAEYDPATGAPLDQAAFADAVVSYRPDAHPTRIATRFHVLGLVDDDRDGMADVLVIATSDGESTIDGPSGLLFRLGVSPDTFVALDGGASVVVWNRRAGWLHRAAGGQPLPHYLVVRPRAADRTPRAERR